MYRLFIVLSLLVIMVGLPLWLFPEDPCHRIGFILTLAGIIVLIVSLVSKKNSLKKDKNK
jgi:hypothetical protein